MIEQTAPELGAHIEEKARIFLESAGLVTVRKNFRCRLGEIDLIMNDRGTLVFIEVRFRGSEKYGGALESITLAKRRKIERVAQLYLQAFSKCPPCRFDVIWMGETEQLEWIKGAW